MKNEVKLKSRAVSCFALRKLNEEWQVLILRRVGEPLDGEWCQVAGRLEADETAWAAALRELKEETALVPDRFYSGDICEQFYVARADAIVILPVFVAYIESGQKVVLNEEHSEFRWMTLGEALAALPFRSQRKTLKEVWAGFVEEHPHEHLSIKMD